METIIGFLTSPEAIAIYVTLGVTVLDAVISAVRGQHPLLAQALSFIANFLRAKANTKRLPPMGLFLAVAFVLAAAAPSPAVWYPGKRIKERIDQRRTERSAPTTSQAPCICGDSCTCPTGNCPAKCPVANACTCGSNCQCPYYAALRDTCPLICPTQFVPQSFPACSGGSCAAPAAVPATLPVNPSYSNCPGGTCPLPTTRTGPRR